ncbi:hypothetical protein DPMN_116621 [Dreissena polymorpha]|uniref:Neurotransmitter-gated ion-channel ligand-binding domain-containing protein n=1 Tax=Dreissena polymorpha TaxID=45954 RepID=A0A9D4KP57_DREPO|nr:hypothetical protein DPMN_116621 [Dreissena polymorpha]
MFLRKSWMDKRLAYNDVLNWTRLELDQSLFGTIWQPDVYISTESNPISITSPCLTSISTFIRMEKSSIALGNNSGITRVFLMPELLKQ